MTDLAASSLNVTQNEAVNPCIQYHTGPRGDV